MQQILWIGERNAVLGQPCAAAGNRGKGGFPFQSFAIRAHFPEVLLRHKIGTRTVEPFGQFLQPTAAIELSQGSDHRIALGFRARVFDGFPKRSVRNINGRFHVSKVVRCEIFSFDNWNPKTAAKTAHHSRRRGGCR